MIDHPGIDRWISNMRVRDSSLSSDQEAALRGALSEIVEVEADRDVVREHDRQTHSHLLLEGWAGRYVDLADGRRQIVALHISGDFVDLHSFPLQVMDHSVATFTPTLIALAPHDRLRRITEQHAHLARLLWLSTLIDAAVLRQWLVGAGKRSVLEQAAHLFCELFVRLQLAGMTDRRTFPFPLSQAELADTLGASAVHTNRVLQDLRARGLLAWRGGRVEILDWDELSATAGFDATYLNLVDRRR